MTKRVKLALALERVEANPAECVCFNLRKATRAVTQVFEEALKPSGIKATQFSVLIMLGKAGSLNHSVLAEWLGMDSTTLSRNLRPLKTRGLIDIRPGDDRRYHEISLTDEGRRVLVEALPLWEEVQNRVTQSLGNQRWTNLYGTLNALIDNTRTS